MPLRGTAIVRELSPQVALVIQAHPDDADISSGGTVAKWAWEGSSVTYVICTSGEAGSSKPPLPPRELGPVREQEERDAAEILGVSEVLFLRHPDGGLNNSPSLVNQITDIVLRLRPAVVVTHDSISERGGHPDHWNAGAAAMAAVVAARQRGHQVEQILLFRSREPDTVFDISETMEVKLAAIEQHRTQRALGEAPPDAILEWAKSEGERCGIEMAESFKALTLEQCEALVRRETGLPNT